MKIGIFSDTYLPQVNGVVTSIKILIKELESLGHEIYVFVPHIKGKGRENLDKNVYQFHSVPFLGHQDIRVVNPFSKHLISLRKLELDVIHSHTPFSMGLLAMQQAKKRNIPLVHTYHTLFTQYVHYLPLFESLGVWMTKRASRRYCNSCDMVFTPSTAMAQELKSYGIKTAIDVIPTGVDVQLIEKGNAVLVREQNHIPPEVEIVSYAGRLAKEKNLDFLMHVFRKVADKRKLIQFMMIGDGPERSHLERLAKQLHLERQVIFTGYLGQSDLASWYKATDVFAFSSLTETQGLVILEAMSMGVPVVAVDAMGVSDFIRSQIGGFSSAANVDEFSARVVELLSDDALRSRKSQQARKLASDYSSRKMAEKIANHYQELISKKKNA